MFHYSDFALICYFSTLDVVFKLKERKDRDWPWLTLAVLWDVQYWCNLFIIRQHCAHAENFTLFHQRRLTLKRSSPKKGLYFLPQRKWNMSSPGREVKARSNLFKMCNKNFNINLTANRLFCCWKRRPRKSQANTIFASKTPFGILYHTTGLYRGLPKVSWQDLLLIKFSIENQSLILMERIERRRLLN